MMATTSFSFSSRLLSLFRIAFTTLLFWFSQPVLSTVDNVGRSRRPLVRDTLQAASMGSTAAHSPRPIIGEVGCLFHQCMSATGLVQGCLSLSRRFFFGKSSGGGNASPEAACLSSGNNSGRHLLVSKSRTHSMDSDVETESTAADAGRSSRFLLLTTITPQQIYDDRRRRSSSTIMTIPSETTTGILAASGFSAVARFAGCSAQSVRASESSLESLRAFRPLLQSLVVFAFLPVANRRAGPQFSDAPLTTSSTSEQGADMFEVTHTTVPPPGSYLLGFDPSYDPLRVVRDAAGAFAQGVARATSAYGYANMARAGVPPRRFLHSRNSNDHFIQPVSEEQDDLMSAQLDLLATVRNLVRMYERKAAGSHSAERVVRFWSDFHNAVFLGEELGGVRGRGALWEDRRASSSMSGHGSGGGAAGGYLDLEQPGNSRHRGGFLHLLRQSESQQGIGPQQETYLRDVMARACSVDDLFVDATLYQSDDPMTWRGSVASLDHAGLASRLTGHSFRPVATSDCEMPEESSGQRRCGPSTVWTFNSLVNGKLGDDLFVRAQYVSGAARELDDFRAIVSFEQTPVLRTEVFSSLLSSPPNMQNTTSPPESERVPSETRGRLAHVIEIADPRFLQQHWMQHQEGLRKNVRGRISAYRVFQYYVLASPLRRGGGPRGPAPIYHPAANVLHGGECWDVNRVDPVF